MATLTPDPSPPHPDERRWLWMVFFVAMAVIGLETVSFQALSFVADYMLATEVLSIALLGLSLGGVVAWVWPKGGIVPLLVAFPLTVLATFPIVARLSDHPVVMMAAMTAPYVVASVFISRMFGLLSPHRVYLYDLVGAGVSAVVVVVAVPWLREEGSFFLLGLLASVPLLLYGAAAKDGVARALGGVLVGACVVLLALHLVVDPFNLLLHAKGDGYGKLFASMFEKNGEPRWEVMYSRGSLIERIDIVHRPGEQNKGPWRSVYNGRVVDDVTPDRAKLGRLDNRMPTLLKLGQNPETLLVGPSGQGLCKAVQALGDGHVDAVEINGAIAGIMSGPLYERSGRAYGGMDLTVGDVRTFLARSDRRYDYITLLNTHRIWSMGHQGPPEYVHTLEAMRDYFEHLKPDGWVLFEERNINERADLGIRRLLHTAFAALRERGVADPSSHLALWELYHDCKDSPAARRGEGCKRKQLFTFVMIKNTPITPEEEAHLLEWGDKLTERGPDSNGNFRGIVWRFLPSHPTAHYWTRVARAERLEDLDDVDPAKHSLSIVTDDVPYPYDVFRERPELDAVIRRTVGLAGVMVLFPASLAFFRGARSTALPAAQRIAATGLLTAFFGVLGLAYLLVEVVLIQKLGIFLSSPVYSLVVVLGTLLVASGIGGFVSSRLDAKGVLGVMLAVLVLVGAAPWLEGVLDPLLALPFGLRVLAAIALVTPLAFAMGMPFPHAMALVKERLGESHAGLMFAVNGAVGAVAAPVGLVLSMNHGFDATLLVGGALYGVCAALLLAASLVLRGR